MSLSKKKISQNHYSTGSCAAGAKKIEPKSRWYGAATGCASVRKKSGKFAIVQAAKPEELANATYPAISEKVVAGILEIEKVTESDVRGGGVSKSDKK